MHYSPNHDRILTINGHYPVNGVTPDPSKRYVTLLFAYNHPFSRGSVHSTSKDPHERPSVDPNYLSSPIDSSILARTLALTRRVAKTAPFSESVIETVVPTFDEHASAEVVHKYLGDTLATVHHPLGTASMLPRDLGGVVGPDLLVYGTENLRIVSSQHIFISSWLTRIVLCRLIVLWRLWYVYWSTDIYQSQSS